MLFSRKKHNEELIPLLFGEIENDSFKKLFPDVVDALKGNNTELAKALLVERTRSSESRLQIIAWRELKKLGIGPDESKEKQLLGFVIEVGLNGGTDYLAVYPDNRARYFNFSGAKIIWESNNQDINNEIQKLIEYSQEVVNQIGVWDKPRRDPPGNGIARINFLTPIGLHFGEAPLNVLAEDPLAKQVISQSIKVMKLLTEYKGK